MDTRKIKVIFRSKAENTIYEISKFIAKKGYTETSKKFAERLYQFGNSLAVFQNKYPICKHKNYAKRNLHCAVFEHDYVFIYKIVRFPTLLFTILFIVAILSNSYY